MAGDLGMAAGQVHDAARAVLDFWFGLTKEQHFAKDPVLDREIADRFGSLRDAVLAADGEGWRGDPDTLLAAVILLDQLSRNLHRGSAEAFAADPLAERLALYAIDRGWDARVPPERRIFLYMPLTHAEDRPLQALSVTKFEALGIAENLDYARAHRDAIERFGRFPGRNAALGRTSSAAEEQWLEENDGGW